MTRRSVLTAPSSNKSCDSQPCESWTPVADAAVSTDGLDDNWGSNANYDRITANTARKNTSFQKHLSSTTQSTKMSRAVHGDTDTDVSSAAHRTTPNTQTSPSSSSKPRDDCYAAEGDNAAFYENRYKGEQISDEQAASAALEESFNGMLMAWYQSGYATGRYQALLEQSKKSSNSQSQSQYWNQPPLQPQYQGRGQGQGQNKHQGQNKDQQYESQTQTQSFASTSQSHPHPPRGSHS